MFKLPQLLSPRPNVCELADYMELQCWVLGRTSRQATNGYLGQIDDNIDADGEGYEGCDDADEMNEPLLDETMSEIERRQTACCGGYPFRLDPTGTILRLAPNVDGLVDGLVYLYLLAATCLNMLADRKQAGIDGTLEMEHLSAHALRAYLGCGRSRAVVFGTSVGGSFEDRVKRLCDALEEPTRFENIDGVHMKPTAQDDKLDVVAWLPFGDRSPGQLIVFAQAKTGTNWRGKAHELSPEAFQNKWLTKHFLVPPLRAFCVAEVVRRASWNATCIDTGLLFDRCRLVECCAELECDLKKRLGAWVAAAKKTITAYLAN